MPTLSDISFIVIARNEEFGISKCLQALAAMDLAACQVICVDSNSTDGTRVTMDNYAARWRTAIEVCDCAGIPRTNAAVARNRGLSRIRRSKVMFVDGDVELNEKFLIAAALTIDSGRADFVYGPLREIRYAPHFKEVRAIIAARQPCFRERPGYLTGGIFMAKTSLVRQAGFWDEGLAVNEDFDYTLRLSRLSVGLTVPISMGTHHTLELNYTRRAFDHLLRRYPMFFGVLVRRHLFVHPRGVRELVRRECIGTCGFVATALLAAGLSACWLLSWPPHAALTLPVLFMIADITRAACRKKNLLSRIIINYAFAPVVIAGLIVGLHGLGTKCPKTPPK